MASMTYAQIIDAANYGRPFHAANHGVRGISVAVASPISNVGHLDWSDDMSFHAQVMHAEKTQAYTDTHDREFVEHGDKFVRYIVTHECFVVFLVMNDGTVVFNAQGNMDGAKGRRVWDRLFDGYRGHPGHPGGRAIKVRMMWEDYRGRVPAGK